METRDKRYIFVDVENVQKTFLSDLCWVRESDTMVFMHSDEVKSSLSFSELDLLHKTKAQLLFEHCSCGRPSALDFQLSSLLGYYVKEVEDKLKKDETEFCILSKDTGYMDAVQFWNTRGFYVTLRQRLGMEPVTVQDEQDKAKQAQMKRRTPGITGSKEQVLRPSQGVVNTNTERMTNTVSAVDKFNMRVQKAEELQKNVGSKSIIPVTKLTKEEEDKRKKEAGISDRTVEKVYAIPTNLLAKTSNKNTVDKSCVVPVKKIKSAEKSVALKLMEVDTVILTVKENLLQLSLNNREKLADWYNSLSKAVKSSEYSKIIENNMTKIKRCDSTLSAEDVLALSVQALVSKTKQEFIGYLDNIMDSTSVAYLYLAKSWETKKLNK